MRLADQILIQIRINSADLDSQDLQELARLLVSLLEMVLAFLVAMRQAVAVAASLLALLWSLPELVLAGLANELLAWGLARARLVM